MWSAQACLRFDYECSSLREARAGSPEWRDSKLPRRRAVASYRSPHSFCVSDEIFPPAVPFLGTVSAVGGRSVHVEGGLALGLLSRAGMRRMVLPARGNKSSGTGAFPTHYYCDMISNTIVFPCAQLVLRRGQRKQGIGHG